jgi:hypothetical protein
VPSGNYNNQLQVPGGAIFKVLLNVKLNNFTIEHTTETNILFLIVQKTTKILSSLVVDQLQLVPSGGYGGSRRDHHGTQMLWHLHPGPISSASRVSQFLRPADDLNTANYAWVLSVSANIN